MRHVITSLSVALIIAVALPAQNVLSVSQSRVLQGDAVTVTFTAPEGGAELSDSCVIDLITAGTPTGPIVHQASSCLDLIVVLGPGESTSEAFSTSDDEGGAHPAGVYYAWCHWRDAGGDGRVAQVAFEIVENIHLSQQTAAMINTVARFRLDAPNRGGRGYLVAASASHRRGFWLQDLHFALDQDALFAASISPSHALFNGFQGLISEDGEAPGIAVKIPSQPELSGSTFFMQGLIYDLEGGAIEGVSNVLSVRIG